MVEVLSSQIVREWGERYSNRGRWGPDDRRGTLNFITREQVLAACALPRIGRAISCALPFDEHGPRPSEPRGRHDPIHTRLADGDVRAHSIDRLKDGVIGRGVLLDMARYTRLPWLDDGTRISPTDLDFCAEAFGVTIERGDIVLVRTGMMKRCLERKSWEGYCDGPAPGLSVRCAGWIYEREIAALATDTWGVEVRPNETEDCLQPLHRISVHDTGLLLGEIFALDDLADACANDGNYAFLFVAPPLPITGAVGSPINPLAIK